MIIRTQMTIIRERREFIQSKEKETRRIVFYIQADMHKRSIEREEAIRQNATSLFCIIIEIPTFLLCRYVACRQSFTRHFAFDILTVDVFTGNIWTHPRVRP